MRREGLCEDAQVGLQIQRDTYVRYCEIFPDRKSSLMSSLTFFTTILLRNFSSVRLIVFAGGCAIIGTAELQCYCKAFSITMSALKENQVCRKIAYVKTSKKEKDNEKGEKKKIEKMVRLRNAKNNYAKREQENYFKGDEKYFKILVGQATFNVEVFNADDSKIEFARFVRGKHIYKG